MQTRPFEPDPEDDVAEDRLDALGRMMRALLDNPQSLETTDEDRALEAWL